MNSGKEAAYDWAIMPDDLPKKNLVLITAKTPHPTFHKEDKKFPVRLFTHDELYEAARSLAHRAIGLNHLGLIEKAFTVDAQFNKSTENVEALCYFPDEWIGKVRTLLSEGKQSIFSVGYTWRDERYTEAGVEFIGLIFDQVDLLCGLAAGDKFTSARLVESAIELSCRRACMEAEVIPELGAAPIQQAAIQDSLDEEKKGEEMAHTRNLATGGAEEAQVQVPEETNMLNNSPQSPISELQPAQSPEVEVQASGRVINDAGHESSDIKEEEKMVEEKKEEPKKEEPKSEEKKEEVKPDNRLVEAEAQLVVKETLITAQASRIGELEGAFNKLQEKSKTFDSEKLSAVTKARCEAKREVIEEVKTVIPATSFFAGNNQGAARVLITDIKKVIYKVEKNIK